MASQQQARKQHATEGHQEADQGQAMNLEEIGKYRAEAQQRSADAIRAAEDRFHKANNQQAPGATVVPYQESVKQGGTESHGRGSHGSEAQQWLADAAADARERCNKALGTSPAAAHEGKASAAHATAGAAPHQQTKNEREGGQLHGHLTRQDEMGKHGTEAQKNSTAEAARAAVDKHDKGRETGAIAGKSVKDTADYASAKDTGARGAQAAEEKTQEATGKAADYTKQAAAKVKDVTAGAAGTTMGYAKQAAVKAKDVTLSTGETAAEYAKQAAVKGKDMTLSTGETAAEYAKAAAEKAKEAAVATGKTTAGYTQQAAVKAKDATVSTGAQVAQKATEVTADTARKVAEYAKEKAEQGKERAAGAADEAEEPGCGATAQAKESASLTAGKARDTTEQHEDSAKGTTGDMARKAADTAVQAKDVVKYTAVSMVQKAGGTAVRAKDTARDAAGGMAQRSRETGAQAGVKAKDVTWRAEQKVGELKESASGTVKTGGGASTTKAKGGDDHETTVVGDVLEAVGATVVGLAQHTKGIVAGEEELVPVDGEKGKSPEKTKLA